MRLTDRVTCGKEERCIQNLTGETSGRKLLGKPMSRWEGNIKMELYEVGWGGMNWIELVHDRDKWWSLLQVVVGFRVP